MVRWQPQNEPPVSHTAAKYWAGINDFLTHSNLRRTVGSRPTQLPIAPLSWQPPIVRAQVVSHGLADGPTGQ